MRPTSKLSLQARHSGSTERPSERSAPHFLGSAATFGQLSSSDLARTVQLSMCVGGIDRLCNLLRVEQVFAISISYQTGPHSLATCKDPVQEHTTPLTYNGIIEVELLRTYRVSQRKLLLEF